MFEIGDYIVYAGEGVCKVAGIGPPPVPYLSGHDTYYTLTPLYHGGTIFAPTDVSVVIRPVLTRDEALSLIRRIPEMPEMYERKADMKLAAQEYRNYLQTYDAGNLIHLIRMIYIKNRNADGGAKAMGSTDERFMKRAKELLYGELAISLGIPTESVERAITDAVDGFVG